MPEKFIHLRFPDGREQRVVAGAAGERVAAKAEAQGAKRFEPDAAYTAEDAEKAAKAQRAAAKASKPAKSAEKTAEKAAEAKTS